MVLFQHGWLSNDVDYFEIASYNLGQYSKQQICLHNADFFT